ncbi:hypothetical protein V5N11_003523 [Cardamine amara subsp. amara]|uniref:Arabidopsis retrotransposon Orf1 C-terminal domain-containing protein n=1 Tax=Cardamine amara subsp. amara TaxID=228776 RepID=A0ABD1C250_CARAN
MASRGKRARRDATVSRGGSPDSGSSPDSSPPSVQARHPWPKREGKKIVPSRVWEDSPKAVAASDECVYRNIAEVWDDYDTLFYNAWLGVEILPTRLADGCAVRRMGIKDDVTKLLTKIGLGTIATTHYELFPDLVRQFLATVRVYYENEIVKNAQEGILTFLVRGVRYRLPLRDLCELYGFDPDLTRVALPALFFDANVFWSYFGTGIYDSKTSAQTDIRHPVLRYVARIIANTLLCKMKPGNMRMSELILLNYAVGDLCEEGCEWPELDSNVNLGAIFAHHLVPLKTKPFLGRGTKRESVGRHLTPIFRHFGIDTSSCSIVTTRAAMDQHYLKNARWIKGEWIWCFRTAAGSHMIQLPQRELTAITDDPGQLHFEPDSRLLRTAPPARPLRGASSSAPPTAAEDAPIPDLAGGLHQQSGPSEIPPFEPLLAPEIPMETAVFQRFVVDSLQRIWDTMSRCTCIRPPRHRSVSPPLPRRTACPAPDESSEED